MKILLYRLLLPFNFFYKKLNSSKLTVLAYHTVPDKEKFDNQLAYLNSVYNVIDLKQLKAHLFKKEKLPKRPLLITFDDGDYSVYKNGLEKLVKYKLPAILFIISELINSNRTFWCRWMEQAYTMQGKSYLDARKEVNRLKKVSNEERMNMLSTLPSISSRQLGIGEISEMERCNITMGNHTHTHPMMDKCTEEEICYEMNSVKSNFEKWGLEGYPYFAYPNGNFTNETEELLISKDISIAFLFDHKINDKNINPLRISRIRVNSDAELNEFKVKVSGLHSSLLQFKTKIKGTNLLKFSKN